MIPAQFVEWTSVALLVGIAVLVAIAFIRLGVPWFLGAPLSGVISISLFELVVHFLLGESEKFLYIALIVGAVYATGFALVPYVGRAIARRIWSRQRTVRDSVGLG
jgi:hypothetical protein